MGPGRLKDQPQKEPDLNEYDNTAGYDIPVDPMDDLQCESCQ